ncbi:class I SAM-dependent methyltransferase [Psychrobacillus glaciei]|uniref:Class I SAM-dependent methyltransferase n=1 Tax=Psychrobacillus glaciei TaxID=2283160 RepID=A0A5J6SMK0_9BACI|nr:class I SAM-dependent methyltransferase [Psychrobacillus glaciei]QFF99175.1 class I SAM-dependent methyltransferase [Psychrobacillus glaciei]
MANYGEDLFKGAALYYSRYRPIYPASLIRFLITRFNLDGSGQMLDLGCGDGRLALRLTDWFEKIVGVDMEPEMIQLAQTLSREYRIENTERFIGDVEKYKSKFKDEFRMVTIAKAFHWMDRPVVLDHLYEMISDGGGIAIIDNFSPTGVLLPWQKKVRDVVDHWYGNERRAGNTIYSHPEITHQEIIANSKFDLEVHQIPPYELYWTINSIIGNHYSTSYGSKRFLGENVTSFEEHLKEELLAIDPTGVFIEEINTSVKLAFKK